MANQSLTLKQYIDNPTISNGLDKLLGKNAQAFKSNLLYIVSDNKMLEHCTPKSIVGAAVCATVNNLSLTPSLGHAYIVPFKGQAQFQVGVRGMIQLAHRTGQYVRLHAGKIHEGELKGFNALTGEPELGEKISDNVVGYVAYFRLVNGFEKYLYMTLNEVEAHAEKYSRSFGKDYSPWSTNFDEMAAKTILKKLLKAWGILSTEMAQVIQADQSVVDKNTFTYVDNGGSVQNRDTIYTIDQTIDAETGEIFETDSAHISETTPTD